MVVLSILAMEKLLRKAGAPRVSKDAAEQLREILEDYALEVGKKAAILSEHAGRRTVLGSDVKLARK